jgi:D-glycero-D-manno-heptose 1,7-bisphosphate phosphatase
MTKTKVVFLDRDGVLNEDNPNYTYRVDQFKILPGVLEALRELKSAGYLLLVVTNQSGIAQGIYTQTEMEACHEYLQDACGHLIDHFYFSPCHPTVSASLARKPGTLMFEKAKAKFNIDFSASWMVGDRGRDIIPARQLGLRTIQIGHDIEPENKADFTCMNLKEASSLIRNHLNQC